MKAELFQIEVKCEETGDWIAMEVSPNPYPVQGGDAEELVSAGSPYRWLALGDRRSSRLNHKLTR